MTTTNAIPAINISSVAAETVPTGMLQLIVRWKDSEKRTISPANRLRSVLLPANIWKGSIPFHQEQSFQLFVHDAITDLAKSFLSTIVEDSNWQRTSVNESAFSLSALLTWNAEQAAASGRLNGEEIKAWLMESVTIKMVSEKHGKEIAAALGNQFVKLAGPNHGLTPEKAGKILANIFQQDDADNNTGLRVMLRLQAIEKRSADSANVLDSIL